VSDFDVKYLEHRRSRRTRLNLRGRFLLSDGGEHPCETIDVSVTGLALRSYVVANPKERVVAYIDELGRLEGVVTRRGADWFAIEVKISAARIERLAHKLAALSGDAKLSEPNTLAAQTHWAELHIEFGQSFRVQVSNQTRFGARIVADFQLLPGVRITLDRRSAIVVRHAPDGFLIDFN
jgi:hypothetical protein